MSLFTNPPDSVEVYVEVETTDDYGNVVMVPTDTPIQVSGLWQPSTVDESAALGQESSATYRFLSRTFPGGAYARVVKDGVDYDVVGDPRHQLRIGGHFTTYLKER